MLSVIKAVSVICQMLVNFGVFQAATVVAKIDPCCPPVFQRQNSIPVLYVTGTHYEVGYSVGRTYATMIQTFISQYEPLQKEMLPLYAQEKGKQIYNDALDMVQEYFPQYVIELQGMADGADVQFHELFLMALDDTLAMNMETNPEDKGPVGCSSLIINQPNAQLLGHTEDALSETINNYYIIAAHVIPGAAETGGVFPAREEKFEALTYAGHLPGYASGHNYHGLVFSINTIFVSRPLRGRVPREFITRALLATRADMAEILDTLHNTGAGTADGFNVNLGFLNAPRNTRVFHTIEVTPSVDELKSDVHVSDVEPGRNSFHTNRLLRSTYPEKKESGYQSSLTREARYFKLTTDRAAANVRDMLAVLGNQDDDTYPLFSDRADARVSNMGVFDFDRRTWTMWSNNPIFNSPILELPLTFTNMMSEVNDNRFEETEPIYKKFFSLFKYFINKLNL